jgi:hypothetical protein
MYSHRVFLWITAGFCSLSCLFFGSVKLGLLPTGIGGWCTSLSFILSVVAMALGIMRYEGWKIPTTRRSIRIMDVLMYAGLAVMLVSCIIGLAWRGTQVAYVIPFGLAMVALSIMMCAASGHRVLVAAWLPDPGK